MKFFYETCKSCGVNHARQGKLCRLCQGLVNDKELLRERKRKGLPLRPPLFGGLTKSN